MTATVLLVLAVAVASTVGGCRRTTSPSSLPSAGQTPTTTTGTQPTTPSTAPAVPTSTPGSELITSPAKPYAQSKPSSPGRKVDIGAYRGLGAWVDIYDPKAWNNPTAVIADMANHRARVLFLETGNFHSKFSMYNPAAIDRFIKDAHDRGIFVVAWYLPGLSDVNQDYARIAQAIRYRTPSGDKFDSMAIDIESTQVQPISVRNARLASLSSRLRALVGPRYPLGGIIPSPLGLTKAGRFWSSFPYATVARYYDVIVPMAYYTYHGNGGQQARTDALGNMTILRAQPGCSSIPVHLVGGLTNASSNAEVFQFARVARQTGCVGTSLYDWVGMSAGHWRSLNAGWPQTTK